jgi:hypothetical protein
MLIMDLLKRWYCRFQHMNGLSSVFDFSYGSTSWVLQLAKLVFDSQARTIPRETASEWLKLVEEASDRD